MTLVDLMVQRHGHFSSPFIGDRQWVPAVNLTKTRFLYWPCFEVEDLHAGVDVHTADVPHGVVDSLPGEQVVRVQPAPGRLADEAGRGAVRRLHRHPRAESRDSHSQISLSSHFCLLLLHHRNLMFKASLKNVKYKRSDDWGGSLFRAIFLSLCSVYLPRVGFGAWYGSARQHIIHWLLIVDLLRMISENWTHPEVSALFTIDMTLS